MKPKKKIFKKILKRVNNKVLVFGCSGTVGLDFINVNKNKNILYYSRKKPKMQNTEVAQE